MRADFANHSTLRWLLAIGGPASARHGLPSIADHERIGNSLQERRAAFQKRATLVIGFVMAAVALSLAPLLWTEFSQLFDGITAKEFVLKKTVDDLARVIFVKIGCWFVVSCVAVIAAIIWLVRTSGVECAQCHKILLFPKRWDWVETQGTCPCCQAPHENQFKAGTHDVAKDRAERLRILKRNYTMQIVGLIGWSITLVLSLITLAMRVDWALILVCANGVVLAVNVIAVQVTRRQIRSLADADAGVAPRVK